MSNSRSIARNSPAGVLWPAFGWILACVLANALATFSAKAVEFTNRLDFTYQIERFNPGKDDPYKAQERELTKLFNRSMDQAQVAMQLRGQARVVAGNEQVKAKRLLEQVEQIASVEVKAWEAFLARYPKHTRARMWFTEVLRELGMRDEAFEQLKKARDNEPENPAPWVQLGHYYTHAGQLADTIECHCKAIELNRYEPAYYQNLANVIYLYRRDAKKYFQIDDQQVFDQVVELYRRATELDPANFRIAVDAAETFQSFRPTRPEIVISAWVRALKATDNPEHWQRIYLNLARTELLCGRFDDAHRHLDRVNLPSLARMKTRYKRI